MNTFIEMFYSDKQALALFVQAFATIAIGVLAWTAARGQNYIAEKAARKELFKLRYENLYVEANKMFASCYDLAKEYGDICLHLPNKSKDEKEKMLGVLKSKYSNIRQDFIHKIESNKFLIKPKDYDKLYSFCDKYLSYIREYIYGTDNKEFPSYDIVDCFNEHYKVIPRILSAYLYYENENKLSLFFYKMRKYFKEHWYLFIHDYFPVLCDIAGSLLLLVLLICGILYSFIELTKEILKAPLVIEERRIKLKLKWKSDYLKRNRP